MKGAKKLAQDFLGMVDSTDPVALQFALDKLEIPKEDTNMVPETEVVETIKFGSETLQDESMIYFEGETIGAGTAIFLTADVDEDGTELGTYSDPAPAGDYTLVDGATINLNEEGIVTEAPTEPGEEGAEDEASGDEEEVTMESLAARMTAAEDRITAMEPDEEAEQFGSEKIKDAEAGKAKAEAEAEAAKAKAEAFGSMSAAAHHVSPTDQAPVRKKPLHRMSNAERMKHYNTKN